MIKGILFDLNGTMIDDMDYHTDAWFGIITDQLGKSLSRDAVKLEMYGKNGEVLERIFGQGHFTAEELERISVEKEKRYQEEFKPRLCLIDGLQEFLEEAHAAGIKMAIASAAIKMNVDFVLDGCNIRNYIDAVVCADDVKKSKPDPETFVLAAQQLGLKPEECLVFEDNPNGVRSAEAGGMKSVVITTMHEKHEFEGLNNIIAFIEDYRNLTLADLHV